MSSVPLSARVNAPLTIELPPDAEGVAWRPATVADSPAIHACERDIAAADHPRHTTRRQEIEHNFEQGLVDPATDTIVAVDLDGSVLAWGMVLLLPGQETLVRCRLVGGVTPNQRGRGIGRALLGWQKQRGLQRLAGSASTLPGWLVIPVDGAAASTQRLCERLGFSVARNFLELRRPLSATIAEPRLGGLAIEKFTADCSEATRLARNDAFRDHWASQPSSEEEWKSHVEGGTFRADLSFLAIGADERGREAVAGLVLCSVNEEDWAGQGFSFVYIGLVGVARKWRGRGIAAALLGQTLAAAKAEGLDEAVLDVDADNPTGALGLYSGLGFEQSNSTLTYTSVY